jgi:hypothetical protein
MSLALRSIFVHTSKWLSTRRKILQRLYLSSEGGALQIFIALNKLPPRPGLNPRTLDPMACTLTITPPRTTSNLYFSLFTTPEKYHVCQSCLR